LNKPRLSTSVIDAYRWALIERDGERCAICGKTQEELRHILEVHHINGNPLDYHKSNLRLACKSCNVKERWRLYNEKLRTQSVRSASSEMLSQLKERHERKVAHGKSGYTEREIIAEPTTNYPPTIDLSKTNPEPPTIIEEPIGNLPKVATQSGCNTSASERENITDVATGVQGDDGSRYADRALHTEEESPEMKVALKKEPEYRKWCFENLIPPNTLTVDRAVYGGAEACGLSPLTTRRYLKKLVSVDGPFRIGEGERGHQEVLLREDYF